MTTLVNSTGTWAMTWNGENRLVEMTKPDQRLVFAYDSMGRRWKKEVYAGSSNNWTLQSSHRYLYDGFVQITELDTQGSYAQTRSYRWDPTVGKATRVLSMTLHGANAQTLAFTHDGNKNTDSLIAADGSLVGHYAYGPFGQVIVNSGSLASVSSFRFSSEFDDGECGLVYYNYRHYCPCAGVWTGRDPAGEVSDFNLYGTYDLCNNFDWNGLDIKTAGAYVVEDNVMIRRMDIYLIYDRKHQVMFEKSKKGQSPGVYLKTLSEDDYITWEPNHKEIITKGIAMAQDYFNKQVYQLVSSNAEMKRTGKCCDLMMNLRLTAKDADIHKIPSNAAAITDRDIVKVVVYANFTGISYPSTAQGMELELDTEDFKKGTNEKAPEQVPGYHELGHAIGNGPGSRHPHKGKSDEYIYVGPEDNLDRNGLKELMGIGNELRPFYFTSWRDQANRMYPGCSYRVKE